MESKPSTRDDTPLVVDMIKLLSDELQRVQNEIDELRTNCRVPTGHVGAPTVGTGELYAIQEDNLRLRSQIEDAKARIESLRGTPLHAHDEARLEERLSELSEEASRKDAEYTKSREKLSAKIEKMREKYKEEKSAASQLQQSISEVETQIASINDTHAEASQRLQDLADEVARQKRQNPFSSRTFFDVFPQEEGGLVPQTLTFPAPTSTLLLPNAISALCAPGGYMAMQREEVAFSRNYPKTRCLVFGPAHRYNPKSRGSKGGWEVAEAARVPDRPVYKDLFYRESSTHWCYLGTFQYVGQDARSVQDLGDAVQRVNALLGEAYADANKVFSQGLQLIRTKTVLFADMVPPILIDLVKNMYDCGLLKVACVGWRRIGFSQGVIDGLQVDFQPRLGLGPPTIIQIPKAGSSLASKVPMKRDREEELDASPDKKNRVA